MNDKEDILRKLTDVFTNWQELISSLSEQQILQPLSPSDWTIKDIVVHMWAWQQASVARAEAALEDREPWYPGWWEVCGPDPEEDVDRTNAYIYNTYRDVAWLQVYGDWEEQFQRFVELNRQIPEQNMTEAGKYAWMGNSPLIASPRASWDHHQEHYDITSEWLKAHGKTKPRR